MEIHCIKDIYNYIEGPIKIFIITKHILDNECPNALVSYFQTHNITHQLVAPFMHRVNRAERAIQTFKHHFIAGLSSTPKYFPMHLWCRLIPQAIITLNLMRPSTLNSNISAHAILEGQYDFSKHPMAPPGSKTLVHNKPQQRKTWGPYATDGWYISPALNHYRCYKVYISTTGQERVSDTVEFIKEKNTDPTQEGPGPYAVVSLARLGSRGALRIARNAG